MEFTYSGDIPQEGLPQGIRFKFHSVKGLPPSPSDRRTPLDAAWLALLGQT